MGKILIRLDQKEENSMLKKLIVIIIITIIIMIKILLDFEVQTDQEIEHGSPDIVVTDKERMQNHRHSCSWISKYQSEGTRDNH